MDISRMLDRLRRRVVRARGHVATPQEAPPAHEGERRVEGAASSASMRVLCAALLAVSPLMAGAQPVDGPSTISPAAPAADAAGDLQALVPPSFFLQAAAADQVHAVSLGTIWKLPWKRDTRFGRFATSIEASLGQWRTHRQPGRGHPFTQIGITPSLRVYPHAWRGAWFVDGGIGANVIAPTYHNDGKRFSSKFNFGDHIAIGREFGEERRHEIALRIQHFSNAGIDHPNPGVNFIQLRWVMWR